MSRPVGTPHTHPMNLALDMAIAVAGAKLKLSPETQRKLEAWRIAHPPTQLKAER